MSRYSITTLVFIVLLAGLAVLSTFTSVSAMWFIGIVVLYIAIVSYGATVMAAQFFLRSTCKADTTTGSIAVTFDDGPVEGKTEKVLAILKEHHVPAAFFCIGHRVSGNRQLLSRIYNEGHLIGNHSYWHGSNFDLLPASSVEKELADTDAAIESCVGVRPKFFRPPYGVTNPMLAKAVKRRDYTVIGWSVRSFDTISKDKAKLLKRVTGSLKAGDVVLFHDHCAITLDILPDFFRHVSALGLKIVRVDELLNEKAYA